MTVLLPIAVASLLLAVGWLLARLARAFGAPLGPAYPGVVLLVVVVLAPWLRGDRLLAPTNLMLGGMLPGIDSQTPAPHELLNDAFLQFLPWENEVRRQWRRGRPAFWSHSLEGGSSPWENPQAGVLSPIAILARVFPLRFHLLVALAVKMVVAALGVAALAGALGASRRSAALAGLAFSLSGPMAAWALFPHTSTLAWVPWLALGAVALARRPTVVRAVLCAIVHCAMLLSGHPEVAFAGALLAALLALLFRRRDLGLRRVLAWCSGAALAGALLAAPAILPFALQLPGSQRFGEMQNRTPEAERVLGFEASRVEILSSFLSPYAFGRPYVDEFRGESNWAEGLSGASGAVLLLGLALAVLRHRRRGRLRRSWALLFLAVVLGWLSAAGWTPLLAVAERLPIFGVLEFRRVLLVAAVALAVLAASGLDVLLRAARGRSILPLVATIATGFLSLACGWQDGMVLSWICLAAASALVAVGPRGRPAIRRRWIARLVVASVLLSQVPFVWRMMPRGLPESFFPTSVLVEELAAELSGGPWRAVGSGYELYPSLLPVWGIDEARPHNPMAPALYSEALGLAFGYRPETSSGRYFSAFDHLDHPLLDFLGVRGVVQPAQRDVPEGFVELSAASHRRLLLNPQALPRWFFPSAVRPLGETAALEAIEDMEDARSVQVSRCGVVAFESAATVADPQLLGLDDAGVLLELPTGHPPLLATSIPWSKGWRARTTASALETCLVNGAFLGVRLPPDAARLALVYRPPGLAVGSTLSALAAIALLAALSVRRKVAR